MIETKSPHFMNIQNDASPEDTENTVSSASLCMSPSSERTNAISDQPLCTSTPFAPRVPPNGYDVRDSKDHDDAINGTAGTLNGKTSDDVINGKSGDVINGKTSDVISGKTRADVVNGNVNVNIVSESTYSMDVLSGGESDAGDTLSRRNNNNNSISSNLTNTIREGTIEAPKRRGADLSYFVAKELLMTERTYKRDLELVTVTWSRRVSELAAEASEAAAALARACLALEPLALACGAALARLERALPAASAAHHDADNEEPEYKKIADHLHEYLANTADAYAEYTEHAGRTVGLVESVRRRHAAARAHCAAFEAHSPLPLAALLLRPLHRLAHYEAIAEELCYCGGGESAVQALAIARRGADAARRHLPHAHNHCALCQLQRDITGYDKLLVPEREFIRLGCVYKHSTKGLQQRMLFLFTDLLLVTSRAGGGQFRAHAALATRTLTVNQSELPHTVELQGENTNLLISASNEQEYLGWLRALEAAAAGAGRLPPPSLELAPAADTEVPSAAAAAGGALAHVCWHRAASLPSELLHLALQSQLSGYLLRKFKKSPGWQKLWVVFAMFTLFFYKSWQDEAPLASLPLLGYSVAAPSAADGIDKDFVFKLQFKNHVYFFRADSIYTYNRWVEVLKTPMVHYDHN